MTGIIGKIVALKSFHKISDRKIAEKNTYALKAYSSFVFETSVTINIENIKQ